MQVIQLREEVCSEIDDVDQLLVGAHNWHLSPYGYAVTNHLRRTLLMHRLIMSNVLQRPLLRSELVDHIDGDRLNNKRINLRLATHSQNLANSTPRFGRNYKGAYRDKKRFASRIEIDKRSYYLGSFETPEEAAWMYDQFAEQTWGEFARLNFDYR